MNTPIELPFPMGGINRAVAYVGQPPHTCYDAENMRPMEPAESRARGGSRPAIVKLLTSAGATAVQFIKSVGYLSSGTRKEALVWACGGQVYYSTNGTSGTAVGTNGTLSGTTGYIGATPYLQKLYIADPSDTSHPVKIFDPTAPSSLADLTAEQEGAELVQLGTIPAGCPLIASYRDRLCLAGPAQLWYFSRQTEPDDWFYGADADDLGRAISADLYDGGTIGEIIIAMVPVSKERMLFGCANSLWIMTGDPVAGGRTDNLSRELGILGPASYCQGAAGEVYLLNRAGIYEVAGEGLVPLSAALPSDLRDLDASTNTVSMGFDRVAMGIHLFITGSSTASAWFYHIPSKGWWKTVTYIDHAPTACCSFAKDATTAKTLILGGKDGQIRYFVSTTASPSPYQDDGSKAISSYVKLGPFKPESDGYHDGLLAELVATLDETSGTVTWEVMAGDTAEEAAASTTVLATGTFGAGRSNWDYPMIRGQAISIKLSATTAWQFEQVVASVRKLGKHRL